MSVVSPNGKNVVASNGYNVTVDGSIDDVKSPDLIIIIPSLAPYVTQQEVNLVMAKTENVLTWLKHQAAHSTLLVSSCTGSFFLAEAGLLEGKKATTHWRAANVFRKRYPNIILQEQDLITDNGSLMCGGGASSHINLSLHLIRRYGGEELASHCAHSLVVDPGHNLQSPYALMSVNTDHSDAIVLKAQEYIACHFSDQIRVNDLAERFHVSDRTLMRRFKVATGLPVSHYITAIRIDQARNKLATTEIPLQSIPIEVGYEDFSSFTRLFKNKTGLTMQSYRERFRFTSF